MRLMGERSCFDQARIKRKPPHKRELPGIFKPLERCASQQRGARRRLGRQLRKDFTRVAEHGLPARMPILDIEDGVVAGLLDDFGQVEIEGRVILAVEHHESHGVFADLVDDFT